MAGKARHFDSRVGSKGVSALGVALLTALLIAFTGLLVLLLVLYWPGESPAEISNFLGSDITIDAEQATLMMMAVLGALGAMAHVLPSFFRYVGQRELIWSWVPMYFMTPFVGSLLATITYIVLRAGLIGGTAATGNVWGFAAIATLVGLFNAQASAKLKVVFEAIFSDGEKGSDQLSLDDKDGGGAASGTAATDKTTTNGAGSTGAAISDVTGTATPADSATQAIAGSGAAQPGSGNGPGGQTAVIGVAVLDPAAETDANDMTTGSTGDPTSSGQTSGSESSTTGNGPGSNKAPADDTFLG